ncbi:hypothetical protein NT06LI_0989 [Listeria innocua FSL J1-023]|nr:hypothetical protein NT06LI_0989 [Listeria innocua FSL J1-023]
MITPVFYKQKTSKIYLFQDVLLVFFGNFDYLSINYVLIY